MKATHLLRLAADQINSAGFCKVRLNDAPSRCKAARAYQDHMLIARTLIKEARRLMPYGRPNPSQASWLRLIRKLRKA